MASSLINLPTSIRHAILVFRASVSQSHHGTRRLLSTSSKVYFSARNYASALKLLDSLQSNQAITNTIATSPADKNAAAIPEMLEWARKAGHTPRSLAEHGLKCVHISGTKGKGSVAVMVESVLLEYWKENKGTMGRVGMYTSPHLIHVRERIRIDGSPISEALFTRYFFEIWDRISAASIPGEEDKPGYFRYLTLLAFHAFIREGVQSAVVECGIGGEYDSTNILPAEAVTVSSITSLGLDHIGMLGGTIGSIAWHKGGIMKAGVPAFTVLQDPEAQSVLEDRAKEKGAELSVVERREDLDREEVKLGLEGDFQKDNASLAIAAASSHLRSLGIDIPTTSLPLPFITALSTASIPARCQRLLSPSIPHATFFIDGAHTHDSITQTGIWFNQHLTAAYESSAPPTETMLIFNQDSERDAKALLRHLLNTIRVPPELKDLGGQKVGRMLRPVTSAKVFTYAAFCPNSPVFTSSPSVEPVQAVRSSHPEYSGAGKLEPGLKHQRALAKAYQNADSNSLHMEYGSIEEAIDLAAKVSECEGDRVFVLVCGSLHLAGGVLEVLQKRDEAFLGKKTSSLVRESEARDDAREIESDSGAIAEKTEGVTSREEKAEVLPGPAPVVVDDAGDREPAFIPRKRAVGKPKKR